MKANRQFILLYLVVFLIGRPQVVLGQYKTRLWSSFNVGAPLTDKLDVRASYIKSLKVDEPGFETAFNWYAAALTYQLSKDWRLQLGSAWMHLPSSGRTTHRWTLEGSHKMKLDRRFSLRNSLQLESHNDQEPRFDYRVIFGSRVGLRKRLDFLGVAPSLNYALFFNIGGNPIRYFSESGEEITRKTSNGLHRGRLMANFNFKISKPIRLSLYYINQHEFNLVFSETNKINVLNPINGRIQRPFNNQHIIGFALSYQIKPLNGEGFLPINF
ncbi:DUF2490 domain-containing protein [Algoriphagus confluentis]|uniref:DUF2490 domain-containing protein n=1 Tax=Algoriphagus confluentis TaxID=1697556 RepID=A0ABQ6PPG3_9BACT|nr:hypothetical protein Aconfl_24920 [Algoriphagus confluentis]